MSSLVSKSLVFVMAMVLLTAGAYYGRKAYKHRTEQKLVAQAEEYLRKQDYRNGGLALQRALQLNPGSLEATRRMADLIETARSPMALGWRTRVVQLDPGRVEHRYAWAETALRLGDLRAADEALSGVPAAERTSAEFHGLAGALAWSVRRPDLAEKEYAAQLKLQPTNQACALNLATVRLTSSDTNVVREAHLVLERLTTNAPMRANALRHLAAEAAGRRAFDRALNWSSALVCDPAATVEDRVSHLQLLNQGRHPGFGPYLAGLEREAADSPAVAVLLGRWMLANQGPTNALHWLLKLPAAVQTNQPVPLLITDCQVALKDWPGMLALTARQDWGEANHCRLALMALSQRSLGEEQASRASWRKAVRQSSRRLDRLSLLGRLADSWGWQAEQVEVLREIVGAFPSEQWALDRLVSQFYAEGNSLGLEEVLAKAQAARPADARLKNNLASVALLRKSALAKAHRYAKEAYEAAPKDPFYVTTYAYSLLLQQRTDEAVKLLAKLTPEELAIPAVAAYYGIAQAESGNKALAKEALDRAAAARLLPEESELVRAARARL